MGRGEYVVVPEVDQPTAIPVKAPELTFAEKLELAKPLLLPYMLPLFAVYFAEYTVHPPSPFFVLYLWANPRNMMLTIPRSIQGSPLPLFIHLPDRNRTRCFHTCSKRYEIIIRSGS